MTERTWVVVPPTPGPLTVVPPTGGRARSEIDDVLDDIFGAEVEEGPGAFDAVLLVGGSLLILISWLAGLSGALTATGVVAVLLGSVLPIRALWRRSRTRAREARVKTMLSVGTAIDGDNAVTAALVAAYGRLADLRVQRDDLISESALEAAHTAAMEVGALLEGTEPETPAEIEYVTSRTIALTGLADRLAKQAAVPSAGDPSANESRSTSTDREARARELQALESRAGLTSLTHVSELNELLDALRTR